MAIVPLIKPYTKKETSETSMQKNADKPGFRVYRGLGFRGLGSFGFSCIALNPKPYM